jgi:putative transcriptional regulator
MKTVRVTIDSLQAATSAGGRIDPDRVDATTEAEIARQAARDEAQAAQDAARVVRRVRKRLGLSQADFSERIGVPLQTVRDWEQGSSTPTGAARALLKVLGQAPEIGLAALR